MIRSVKYSILILLISVAVIALTGCDNTGVSAAASGGSRTTRTSILFPEASGTTVYRGDNILLDASHVNDGYIMVKYTGSADEIKIQIKKNGETYTYTCKSHDYETFPLTEGSGNYKVDVLENISGALFTLSLSRNIKANLKDEFSPFLYPNHYVWFTADSKAVSKAYGISSQSADDLDYVEQVYKYVINHVKYDNVKAENVSTDYVPDIDETLDTGKGICFDYASLMSAMLRSQGVPTKLVVGYSGSAYHAWISVWLEETGWVDNIIEFDGEDWSLIDPTLASSNSSKTVQKYIGDGSNYVVKYNY